MFIVQRLLVDDLKGSKVALRYHHRQPFWNIPSKTKNMMHSSKTTVHYMLWCFDPSLPIRFLGVKYNFLRLIPKQQERIDGERGQSMQQVLYRS